MYFQIDSAMCTLAVAFVCEQNFHSVLQKKYREMKPDCTETLKGYVIEKIKTRQDISACGEMLNASKLMEVIL